MADDRWQLLPPLSDDEFRALKADIAAQGVLVPLVIDEDTGEVIEGHHRLKAWTELRAEGVKVPDYPKQVVRFANDDDRVAFVVAANLFRRHLTREQRAEVEARLRRIEANRGAVESANQGLEKLRAAMNAARPIDLEKALAERARRNFFH